jgi:hypothetical protein
MPGVKMQPPGGPMPPQQMGGPQPGAGMPPINMQRPGGPMPPQQWGGGQGGPSQQPGGGGGLPPGFNPAMLQALMAHMQSQGSSGMQPSLGGIASMMGGYGPSGGPMGGGGMAGMFPGMASRMGPMPPQAQGGPQRQMPMNPGLLTR